MNALVAAAARSGMPHQAFSTGTLMMPPPMPSSDDTLPATNDAADRQRQPLHAIGDGAAALVLVIPAAEHAGIGGRIEDHVPAPQAAQHDQRDDHGDEAEQPLQHRLRDELRGDAAEKAAGGGRHFEQHPELHVDQLLAGAAGRHRARRRDHRRQADRRGDGEGKAEHEVEERNEEHAAAEPEQRAEAAGDGAGREDDQRERRRVTTASGSQLSTSDVELSRLRQIPRRLFDRARSSASSLGRAVGPGEARAGSTLAIVQ